MFGRDPATVGRQAARWLRAEDPGTRAYDTFAGADFPHRRGSVLLEVDMAMGKTADALVFVTAVLDAFKTPHAVRQRRLLLIHNIHHLPERGVRRVCAAVGPTISIVATTTQPARTGSTLRSRATLVRVRCDADAGRNAAVDRALQTTSPTSTACRAFAHVCAKSGCPEGEPFCRVAELLPGDHHVAELAATIQHTSCLITQPAQALELLLMLVLARRGTIKA